MQIFKNLFLFYCSSFQIYFDCFKMLTLDLILCSLVAVEVIYQTRETVFHLDIQTLRRYLKIWCIAEYFDEIQGVWLADVTLSQVFDIPSQLKQKLRRGVNGEVKSSKSLIKTGYPNLLHGYDFLCVNLIDFYRNEFENVCWICLLDSCYYPYFLPFFFILQNK